MICCVSYAVLLEPAKVLNAQTTRRCLRDVCSDVEESRPSFGAIADGPVDPYEIDTIGWAQSPRMRVERAIARDQEEKGGKGMLNDLLSRGMF